MAENRSFGGESGTSLLVPKCEHLMMNGFISYPDNAAETADDYNTPGYDPRESPNW